MLPDFIRQHNEQHGFSFDGDPLYAGQCTQLAKAWASLNGKPVITGDGKDWANAFNWVSYRPGLIVPEGAIVAWGTGVGQYGHVGIALAGADANQFPGFDQNWRLDKTCHLEHHNYRGVLGWNTLNALQEATVSIQDEARIKVDMIFESFLHIATDNTKYAQLIVDTVNAHPGDYAAKVDAESRAKDIIISEHRDLFNKYNAHILG